LAGEVGVTEIAANMLIARVEAERRWPPPFDHNAISEVARRAAFREADEAALKVAHRWPDDRPYVVDPIGDRISTAKADLLFGKDPRFRANTDSDQGNLTRIIETADLPSELHYAEQIRSTEGEVWWRIEAGDPRILPCPYPTFHSREVVIPLYVGPALIAAAFVSEFEDPRDNRRAAKRKVWRHLEIQSVGRIENRLYLGTRDTLGEGKDLDEFSETEELETVWDHGLPGILCGRVIFRRGRERHLGRSVFEGNEHLLLALNEAMTIGVENARLVAKRRIVVPAKSLSKRDPQLPDSIDAGDGSRIPIEKPLFDAGEDVLVAGDDLDAQLGKEGSGEPFKVLEYTFDAKALIEWQDKLVKTVASRCGLTVQFLGEGSAAGEGTAETGTALRVRLLPATSASRGSGRSWDDAIPQMLMAAQLLDSRSLAEGGWARSWSDPGAAPAVELQDPLPRDLTEEFARHATATGGPVESIETAVRDLHPDWDDEQVDAEVKAIREDIQTANSFTGLGASPSGNPEEDPEAGGNVPPAPGK
jgi:hypothetical protein